MKREECITDLIPQGIIGNKILLLRGKKVMLDRDLARLYDVSIGNLNKAVKRNIEGFPDDFMLQLTKDEDMKSKKSKKNHSLISLTRSSHDARLSMGKKKSNVVFPVAPLSASLPASYPAFLSDLKVRIRKERLRVVLASNVALIILYWDIGQSILKKQSDEGWGAKVIDRLSADLSKEFPDMKGFSPRNLKYMRSFAVAWPDKTIVQRLVAQIPLKRKNKLIAGYALSGYSKPMGVA